MSNAKATGLAIADAPSCNEDSRRALQRVHVHGLDHLVLTVADIPQSIEFDQRTFGVTSACKNERWSLHF